MTTYNAISDPEIAPGAPGTSSLFTRLRDNVLAIIQGDGTAPKISNAALATVPGQNLHVWDTAGTYSLVIPAGITSIEVDATGAGGAGSAGERRLARIAVTPLETLTIVVGAYGTSASALSQVKRGAEVLVSAVNGTSGSGGTGGIGGTGFPGETYYEIVYNTTSGGDPIQILLRSMPGAPHGGNTQSNGSGVSPNPGLVIVRY